MAGRRMRASVGRWPSGLAVSVAAVALVSGLVALLEPHVPVPGLLVLYILAVLPVAAILGTWLAGGAAVLSTVAFACLFLTPIHSLRVTDSERVPGRLAELAVGTRISLDGLSIARGSSRRTVRCGWTASARTPGHRPGGAGGGRPTPS
jgi:K+-sensing histidine kinase KdpD